MKIEVKYTHSDITKYYTQFVNTALLYFQRKNYRRSINCIEGAAFLQYHYNKIYRDDRLEKLLDNLSSCIFPKHQVTLSHKVYLFYDAFTYDNHGLTQQYIDALGHMENISFVYVAESCITDIGHFILQELKQFINVTIIELEGDRKTKMEKFYDLLLQYKPEKVFLHIRPWSTIPLLPLYAFSNILIYQINLTDHAFWLGADLIDYSLEFRNYGCTVSLEKRNLKVEQLLLLPFYPWCENMVFEGFPKKTEDKVILFSGGSLYKIMGHNDFFFFLVKDILEQNLNAVFMYAGDGNSDHILSLIRKYNLENRFFLIGSRKDIYEVFKHIDIFIGTYPLGGGLMSQYAAINAKPLLIYSTGKRAIEDVVCTERYAEFTFFDREELLKEACLLITNENYRKDRGFFFQSLIMGKKKFRENFSKTILSNLTIKPILYEMIEYEMLCSDYLGRMNNHVKQGYLELKLIKLYGIKSFVDMYKFTLNSLPFISTFLKSRTKSFLKLKKYRKV